MAQSVNSGFPSLSVAPVSWIPFLSGIPDSLSCIPYSKAHDSGFHRKNFQNSRIPVPFMGKTMGVNKLFRCRKALNFQSNVRFNQNQKKSLGFVVDCNFCHFNASLIFIAI